MLYTKFQQFRPLPTYTNYPPYHTGLYLEDYFYHYINTNNIVLNRIFIPVSWTTCYIENKTHGLQEALNTLDPSLSYFTVSQHDDAIKEKLPKNTLKFCAGGNNGGIPIPLICSPIPSEDIEKYSSNKKDLLYSFIGSITHYTRSKMLKDLYNKPNSIIEISKWSINVYRNRYERYLQIALRSKFLLCPRGYGLNSFRLYESFQLGCVPVIITNQRFLPWEDELDWNNFAIIVNDSNNLENQLQNITEEKYQKMLSIGKKVYENYFTLDALCKNIIKRVNKTNDNSI